MKKGLAVSMRWCKKCNALKLHEIGNIINQEEGWVQPYRECIKCWSLTKSGDRRATCEKVKRE